MTHLTDNVQSIGPHPARNISEAHARLETALQHVLPILEACRYNVSLGPTQIKRIEEAKAALQFSREH